MGKAVLVTTDHRGVFFGYQHGHLSKERVLVIAKARNCLYWSSNVHGFLGLATTGPVEGCRVGPAVSSLTLTGVTSIALVTPEAERRWNNAPWS